MKTLYRAINLLSVFQTDGQLGVEEMARALRWPKSSVYRFVQVLRERGLLVLDAGTRKYCLGPLLYQLGKMAAPDLPDIARPALERLTRKSGESSFLSVRSGWEARYTVCVESPERIRFTAPLGQAVPLYAGASAKVILAFMEEEERKMYLRTVRLKRLCTTTIRDRRKLEQALLAIRERGYDFTEEELYRGAWGLAAPILGADGVALAALAITGVKFRMPGNRLPRFISLVREAAQGISQRLKQVRVEGDNGKSAREPRNVRNEGFP